MTGLMGMDFQTLFNTALGVVFMLSGWFCRALWDSVNHLRSEIQEMERRLPETYLRRDDYNVDIAEIKQLLLRISDRMDNKADK
tara:strand:+ start:79 stop:330 length:252 start_codon:yes stop_codon:yes gene_type:complete